MEDDQENHKSPRLEFVEPDFDANVLDTAYPLPDLEAITPEMALGYLNQSLMALIEIHDELPYELDSKLGLRSDEDLHPLQPLTTIGDDGTPSAIQDDDEVSPLVMSRRGESSSVMSPGSPELTANGSISARRRRRSSVLCTEATAVATVVSEDLEDLIALRGRHKFQKRPPGDAISESPTARASISKRFWSKTPPEISIPKYLIRIHKYCPLSTAVYLASAVYIYRLCIVLHALPLTNLCAHRVILTAIRIASKSLEDVNYVQKRFAMVGGISAHDLYRLELAFLYLLDFDIKVDAQVLRECLQYIGRLSDKVKKESAPPPDEPGNNHSHQINGNGNGNE
uniref:ARAD1D44484p n=1 Tax=Blastobotrys adeninivorans TaxID=409370 RepID=A0A060TDJ8_BLAAD